MSDDIPEKLITSVDCKQGAVRAIRFNVPDGMTPLNGVIRSGAGKIQRFYQKSQKILHSADIADGNYCVTCGSNKTVKLWNPHRGLLLKTYAGHGYEVLDARSSSDNSQICSGGMDKTVVLFDVSTGQAIRKYRGHAGTVNCVQFNEESTVVLSGSLDSTVQAWDSRTRKTTPIQVMDEAKDSVTSIQVSDHEILTGSADGRVRRYDLRNGKLFSDFIGASVTSVTFTRDGQCTLVSTLDNKIRLLDKDSGELLNEYEGHKNKEYKIDSCLNCKDTHIVSGSEDGLAYVWDLIDAKILHKLDHSTNRAIHSLTFHPSETCLLTASADKYYVWKSRYASSLS